jgi:hypothetical protein
MSSTLRTSLQPRVLTMRLRCGFIMPTVSLVLYILVDFADRAAGDRFLANSTAILPALKQPYEG